MRRVSDAMTRDGMAGRKKGGKRSTVSHRLGSVGRTFAIQIKHERDLELQKLS